MKHVFQVYPITVAEIEVSPWSYDFQQKKVIAAATELNISVLAYSPLGKGFLTGQIKSPEDLASEFLVPSSMIQILTISSQRVTSVAI